MSKFWSALVGALKPYIPGEQPQLERIVKLNTNENPYPPAPSVIRAIQDAADDRLRLYPDPNAENLKAALARHHNVTPRQVFVGNGSDEVLAHAFQALLKHAKPLLFPDITYSFYPVYAALYGIDTQTIALNDAFEIQLENYPTDNGGIIFANPNAPTGRALTLAAIENCLRRNTESVVVVDEAYVDFGAQSAIALVNRYPNLLVIQTFSKSRSLAALRVGFAVGHADLIEALERVKNSFNSYPLGRLAQIGAVAALADTAYFESTCARIVATRQRVVTALAGLGFEVLPSAANFVFARHKSRQATDIAQFLRQKAIIVRHFSLPRIDNFLRISIGSEDQCDALIDALRAMP